MKGTNKERFLAKVRYTDTCWWWLGGSRGRGYGAFHLRGRGDTAAHRAAWLIANGAIPEGMHVLHSCDNRRCVRPDHLFLGTNADNVADKVAKGRQLKGEALSRFLIGRPKRPRFDEQQVREIRWLYAQGFSQIKIAAEFSCGRALIGRLVAHA